MSDSRSAHEGASVPGAATATSSRSWIRRLPFIRGIIGRRRAEKALRQNTRALSAFLTSALAAFAMLAAFLALEIVHDYVAWPSGHGNWEIAEIILALGLMSAFGIFALGRWRQLARETAERRQTEEALRESEERFRSLFEAAFEAIAIHEEGVILDANPAFEKMFGYPLSELIGKSVIDLGAEESRDVIMENIRSGAQEPYQAVGLRKDGTAFTGELIGKEHTYKGRRVRVTALRDITERNRAEEALRESEERHRDLYENAPNSYFSVAADGLIRRCNRRAHELLGYAPGKLAGRPFFDLYPDTEHGKAKVSKTFQRLLAGETIRGEEMQMIKADGTPVWTSLSLNALKDARGEVVESRSIVVDITERKRAEEALRESEELFATAFADSPVALVMVSLPDGVITDVNRTAELLTGFAHEEMLGRTSLDLGLHPAPALRDEILGQLSTAGAIRDVEFSYLTKSREQRTGMFNGTVIQTGAGPRALIALVDITERKRAEEALRESEERFRSAFEAAATGMALVAPDGRLLQVNRICCETLGYSEQELKATTWQAVTHQDDLDVTQDHVRRVLAGESDSFQLEKRFLHKDGHVLWGQLTSSLLRDYDGRPLYFITQIVDITERKRTEEALRESEKRYRELVENINETIFEVDASGRVTYISPVIENAVGFSPSALTGQLFADFIHPDDLARILEAWERGLSGNPQPVEYRAMSKSGEARWLRSFGQPVLEEDRIVGFRGAVVDITERKRAEKALRESEKRYRELVEDINDVIFELDASGCIAYISPVIERSGYTPSQIVGRPLTEFVHPDDVPALMESVRRNLAGNQEPSEYRVLYKSGEARWMRSFSRPVMREGQAVGLRGVLTDITDRKRAEEALRETREELEAKAEHEMLRRNPYGLTFRELTVLHLVVAGESDKEIGITLGISPLTSQKHVSNILAKMDASSRTEAGVRAVREGLIE